MELFPGDCEPYGRHKSIIANTFAVEVNRREANDNPKNTSTHGEECQFLYSSRYLFHRGCGYGRALLFSSIELSAGARSFATNCQTRNGCEDQQNGFARGFRRR